MADNTGQLLLLRKHISRGNGTKKRRRRFHEPSDIEQLKAMAQSMANRDGEDFLIVQIVHEASKPEKVVKA
jgi:uncharacterized protein YceH (UPF0502 family)